jgi:hypothetical protein
MFRDFWRLFNSRFFIFFFETSDVFSTRNLSHLFFETSDVFSTRDLSVFFFETCDVWSREESETENIKDMQACLMMILEKVTNECVLERQQKLVFCFLKQIIDSHDSVFFFEQTVVSLAVRFRSFWVRARKEEERELIFDKNVFRNSTWVENIIHKKCTRWYASSLECSHARAHSNLHSTSLITN